MPVYSQRAINAREKESINNIADKIIDAVMNEVYKLEHKNIDMIDLAYAKKMGLKAVKLADKELRKKLLGDKEY